MKISAEDRKTIIETLRENLQCLSISELSRKSGINRNKTAQIADSLYSENIISCIHYGNSKIYRLNCRSIIYALLETSRDPMVILDKKFRILETNKPYAEKYGSDTLNHYGKPLFAIHPFQGTALSEEELTAILAESEGTRKVFGDGTFEQYVFIRISLDEDTPGLLLVIQQKRTESEIHEGRSVLLTILQELIDTLPEMGEKRSNEACIQAAEILRRHLPQTLIFSLYIDENDRVGEINTILPPKSALRKTEPILSSLLRKKISIPPFVILKYKTSKPYLSEDITPLLEPLLTPEEMGILTGSFPLRMISLIGIQSGNTLTNILGIGARDDAIDPGICSLLLRSVSHLLSVTALTRQKTEENQRNLLEYQSQYGKIYALLSEKTKENTAHSLEMEYFKTGFYELLDYLGVQVIITGWDGKILSANQTAAEIHNIPNNSALISVSLQDILPADFADIFRQLDSKPVKMNPDIVVDTTQKKPMVWYLIKNPGNQSPNSLICIAEPSPAPLIQYLKGRRLSSF